MEYNLAWPRSALRYRLLTPDAIMTAILTLNEDSLIGAGRERMLKVRCQQM
jgi:hypothetical protein